MEKGLKIIMCSKVVLGFNDSRHSMVLLSEKTSFITGNSVEILKLSCFLSLQFNPAFDRLKVYCEMAFYKSRP